MFDGRERYFFFALHLLVALTLKWQFGLDIEVHPDWVGSWNVFWQHIPLDLLRTNFWQSILYLHSQPPLHNMVGALLLKLFGTSQLQAMQYINIFLGGLMSAMFYTLVLSVTDRRTVALIASLFHALNPALFLFEAYPLYSMPSAFLVLLCVSFIDRFVKSGRMAHLVWFFFTLNVLILYRSLFHPVIVAAFLALTVAVAGTGKRKLVACALAISLLSLSWYGKNWVQYGFFGCSSWFGQNLWRVASFSYTRSELQDLARNGVIDKMVTEVRWFDHPASYRSYGFNETSPIPILSSETLHNINIVAISRVYGQNARRLIAHDPYRYLVTVLINYSNFCAPTSSFAHLIDNHPKVVPFSFTWDYAVYGKWITGLLAVIFRRDYIGSIFVFLIPACLAVFYLRIARSIKTSSAREILRRELLMLAASVFVVYVTLAGSLLESGENMRFKFLVEPVLLIFFLGVLFPMDRGASDARLVAEQIG